MEPRVDENCEEVIGIAVENGGGGPGGASSSVECNENSENSSFQHEDISLSNDQHPATQSPLLSSNELTTGDVAPRGRNVGVGRGSTSPARLYFCCDIVFTMMQIGASIFVLVTSRNVNLWSPIFIWIVGYTAGCVVRLPVDCCRFYYAIQSAEAGSAQPNSLQPNLSFSTSLSRQQEDQNRRRASSDWFHRLVDNCRSILEYLFAAWFLVGLVWMFGGYITPEAPNLYSLYIVFLAINFIQYAIPKIVVGMLCCCLGFQYYHATSNQNKGASTECINALPTYKYKLKKSGSSEGRENNSNADEGGVITIGTESESSISEEDAECCICLAKYVENVELKELPCSHFFHTDCVDKWLKINASCPLCKSMVSKSNVRLHSATHSVQEV